MFIYGENFILWNFVLLDLGENFITPKVNNEFTIIKSNDIILQTYINHDLILYTTRCLSLTKFNNPYFNYEYDISSLNITRTNLYHKIGLMSYWRLDIIPIEDEDFEPLYVYIKHIKVFLAIFWQDVIVSLLKDTVVILQLVGHSIEKEYFNISPFVRTNPTEYEAMASYFTSRIGSLNEIYLKMTGFTFKYYIFKDNKIEKLIALLSIKRRNN